MNVEEKTIAFIADFLGFEPNQVTAESHFEKDLNADSLDVVEITMILEKEFQITIPDEEMHGFATVGDAIESVKKQLS